MGTDEPSWDSYPEGNEQGVPSDRASSPSTPFRPRQGGSLFRLYPSPQHNGESLAGAGGALPTQSLCYPHSLSFVGPLGPQNSL